MLMPKRTKHRKMQKGRNKGQAGRGTRVSFGDYGIKALESGWITSRQIESARIAMTRRMKRVGKVWIRIFPDKPITRKPAETRMGKGKGSPEHFVAPVKPGRVLFEIGGVSEELAQEALYLAAQKLPVKCKMVFRPELTPISLPDTGEEEVDLSEERPANWRQVRALKEELGLDPDQDVRVAFEPDAEDDEEEEAGDAQEDAAATEDALDAEDDEASS